MPKTPAKQSVIYNPIALNDWAKNSGFDNILDEFLAVNEGPADGKCLIRVCELMKSTIANSSFWREIEPFKSWVPFLDQVKEDSAQLQRDVGAHLYPPIPTTTAGSGLLHGKITDSQIFAMLLNVHVDPKLRVEYGCLQMHVILSRWRDAKRQSRKLRKAGSQLTPVEVLKLERDHDDRIRVTDHISKAVRDLWQNDYSELLEYLEPGLTPVEFLKHLKRLKKAPTGYLYEEHFKLIRRWCLNRSDARVGGHHRPPENVVRRPTVAKYVGYGNLRVGVNLPAEEGQPSQQSIQKRAGTEDEAIQLGLHPLERSGGDATILSDVEGAENSGEATAISRSKSRHFEINRRLFPWSSDHLRVEEFRRGILPAIVSASQSDSRDDLEIATLLAIMIDTGREADDVLAMPIEEKPNASLCYQKPTPVAGRGSYFWQAIQPDYKTTWNVDDGKEVPHASYLRFPASALVTGLVEKFTRKARFSSGKMFRREEKDYKKALTEWIKSHDLTDRATARRLTNLRWDLLHRSTGGDLAACCLTLGISESIAAVELHYAALHVSEAREMFEKSSRDLWGDHFGSSFADYDDASPDEAGKIVGIRGFPRLETVRDVVKSLREGSREFFAIPVNSFDFVEHAELLNRAVLYATWHQMHAFATRAICDAYQERSLFSTDGISTLRDKDFEDGHKARMVWADPMLLTHMEAIERRLDEIRIETSDKEFPENGSLWFIAGDGTIEEITPTTIAKHLGADFPLPANTPRKVMRYLVRVRGESPEERLSGLSHEEAEVFMGHWWQSREPWSPFSSFDWGAYLANLEHLIPAILTNLGFIWPPEVSVE
jgi:hypothetical protein